MEQEEAKGCRKLCLSGEERLAEQRKLRARFLFLFFFFFRRKLTSGLDGYVPAWRGSC